MSDGMKTTEEEKKKFNPTDVLTKRKGKELRDYIKSLSQEEVEACIKVVTDNMKKHGVTDEQIKQIQVQASHKFSMIEFIAKKLPLALADGLQIALVASKLLSVEPISSWTWMMVFFPLWTSLALGVILPSPQSK